MAEKILRTEYSEEMQKSYLDYSMSCLLYKSSQAAMVRSVMITLPTKKAPSAAKRFFW